MKKRPIINIEQPELVCDRKTCDYRYNISVDVDLASFVGTKCPKCNAILLTDRSYRDYINQVNLFKWVNKWFSWITYIFPKKSRKFIVHTNDGVHFEKVKKNVK